MTLDSPEIRRRFKDLTVWRRGDQRAPHKPLLLLFALGQYANGAERLIPYEVVDAELEQLLFEFGPPRKSYHPQYPFWRLQNDGLWEVVGVGASAVNEAGDARKSALLEEDAAGGLRAGAYERIRRNPELLRSLARTLLEGHFPSTLHGDICDAVGLGGLVHAAAPERDPDFRINVLTAYEHRCAVCSFDVRLRHVLIGVEAAHIKWHQARGPSVVQNGLALCSLHHKLFDRGAFALSDERHVVVSEQAHGGEGLDDWLLRYHGSDLPSPVNDDYLPTRRYLQWHRREVFRGPARPV